MEILYWDFYDKGIIPTWSALKRTLLKEEFTPSEKQIMSVVIDLSRCHQNYMFSPTNELLSELKNNYGLTDEVLQWFVPSTKIQTEVEKIEKAGIKINQREIGWYLWLYFTLKFNYYLLKFCERKFKDQSVININKDKKDILNFRKRAEHNYVSFRKRQHKDDPTLLKVIDNFKKYFSPDSENYSFLKSLIGVISDNSIEIIREMKRCCFLDNSKEKPKASFNVIIYDFFKLLIPDKNLEKATNSEKADTINKLLNYSSKKVGAVRNTSMNKFVENFNDGGKNKSAIKTTSRSGRTNSKASVLL